MPVRFSTRCPNSDYLGFEASPEAIVAAAKKAEEVGFDAIFVNDHIIVDGSPRAAPWTNVYDPFVAMSFIAAHTARIGVGVSVLIMPYRNPIATAKSLATIDRMSGGRLIAGVGAGWNESEFAALGVPFRERGPRTNEYLRLWQACWSPSKVSFAGRFFSFSDMHVSPKPVQQPYPPIWIGGTSDAALRRVTVDAGLRNDQGPSTDMMLADRWQGRCNKCACSLFEQRSRTSRSLDDPCAGAGLVSVGHFPSPPIAVRDGSGLPNSLLDLGA